MRIIFINMHCNAFIVNTFLYILQKQSMPLRHKPLIEHLLSENVEVINFITLKGTTLYHKYPVVHHALKRISVYKKEAEYVLRKNGLSGVINITDESVLNINNDDIVIYYEHYLTSFNDYFLKKGCNVIDLTHFRGDHKSAAIAKKINPRYMISEIDLRKYSMLYNRNYDWFDGEIYIRPFAFEKRFINDKEYSKRWNKCFVSGTLASLRIEYDQAFEYILTYNTKYMQPQRKKIYDIKDEMLDVMDCVSYDFDEALKKNYCKIDENQIWIKREYLFWKNYFVGNKFPSYFTDFNIVDKYNTYKMFACAEDANGIYSIGAIEGMACGCAYIGVRYGGYDDLGFIPDYHYITYDGSMDDFRAKVRYYLSDEKQADLETIAKNGCKYVRENFSEEKINILYGRKLLDIRDA